VVDRRFVTSTANGHRTRYARALRQGCCPASFGPRGRGPEAGQLLEASG
jgi:hypothetical protein